MREIQGSFDIIFKPGTVTISNIFNDKDTRPHGEVAIVVNNLSDVVLVESELAKIDFFNEKIFYCADQGVGAKTLYIALQPRPVRDILSKVLREIRGDEGVAFLEPESLRPQERAVTASEAAPDRVVDEVILADGAQRSAMPAADLEGGDAEEPDASCIEVVGGCSKSLRNLLFGKSL